MQDLKKAECELCTLREKTTYISSSAIEPSSLATLKEQTKANHLENEILVCHPEPSVNTKCSSED